MNASTRTDARASFSNWGTCTDIFAPGQDITSAWNTSNTATRTISGTSMAAPHVAGVAALILASQPGLSPAQVANRLISDSTKNKITNAGSGSPNRLLFVNNATQPGAVGLNRYFWPGNGHISATSHPGGGFQYEGTLGKLHTSYVAGTRAIYQCRVGYDYFTSPQSDCAGYTIIGRIGYVYTSPPAEPNHPFRRCIVRNVGEHFDSVDMNCEGHIAEGILGYLLK